MELVDLPNALDGLHVSDAAQFSRVASTIGSVVQSLAPSYSDDEGFQVLCEAAQLTWLRERRRDRTTRAA